MDEVTRVFNLGMPMGAPVHIRRGDNDAYRLNTSTGSYFVKRYIHPPDAELTRQLEVAIAFERRALEAGVDMPGPIDSRTGWIALIHDQFHRVHRWIEPHAEQDVERWLGRTMAQVHQLQPHGRAAVPELWLGANQPRAAWERWLAPWSHALPVVLAAAERLAALEEIPDLVTTHGDFKPHNLVHSATGPLLVDWDNVRTDSAALEAARVAHIFAAGDPATIDLILDAYAGAGGRLDWPGPDLFLSVTRNHLQVIADFAQVIHGEKPPARWMPPDLEAALTQRLTHLTALAQ